MESLLNLFFIVDVLEYIRNFKWEDSKFPRAKPLVEITGLIVEVLYINVYIYLSIRK
jgi:hypothetical protein